MEREFWIERWREGRIGFHEGKPNEFLAKHVARLGEHRRVLVPMCGKTEDLAFLAAHGHAVVGVELVEDAVRAFFAEHGVTPVVTGNVYAAGAITLVAGDFFTVTRAQIGAVDAVYDRAALVALPAEMRPRYVEHVRALAAPGSPAIVIGFEYPPEQFTGPPFSVPEAEIRALYGNAELLGELTDTRVPGRTATERCWLVTLEQR